MNRGIYSTASGMASAQRAMDVVANNLANASTVGFKRDGVSFNDALVRQLRADGGRGPAIGSLGTGATTKAQYTVHERGPVSSTGNPLDVAIDSDSGVFAIQTPQGVRFTRDGSFKLNADGLLVSSTGHPVLDSTMTPIQLPPGDPRIGEDGNVWVDELLVGRLGLFDGQIVKAGANLFMGTATPVENVRLKSQSLESSNVNVVESMLSMITLSRAFEMAQKSITQQDELTQRLIQSLQDR
jgi:flagellar basal-body rod protein FlgF